MKEIDIEKMVPGTQEYCAALFINICKEYFEEMDKEKFEHWIRTCREKQEIQLSNAEVSENMDTEAILQFISDWYYSNKENPS